MGLPVGTYGYFIQFACFFLFAYKLTGHKKHTLEVVRGRFLLKPQEKLWAREMEAWVQFDKGSTNVLMMQKSQPGFEWC